MKKSEKPIGKIKVKKSIFKRLFFHILVLFILAVIVSGTLNCIENIQRTRRFTRQLTESASKVATETFERCDINALLDNPDSEEYRKAVKTLRWICQTNHLEYMYIYIPNFDENKVTYVMTVADDDSENENALNVISAGAEVDHSLWDAEKEAWENPNLVTAYEYQNDSFGSFYTAFSAIQGRDGKPVALIGADYSLTQIYTEIIFYTAMRVLALFVVLAIVFLLVMRFVRKKMYNPILLIFEKIRGYFSDKADGTNTKKAFVPIKLGSDDEIQLLADYFNDMAHDVETYVEKNSALASEKAKNETELAKDERIFPVSKHYLKHEMERGCKATGVKRIRIHDLRHSHVSLLIDMGFTALAIADRVGHESIDITYRYAHLFPTRQTEMADRLDMERKGA